MTLTEPRVAILDGSPRKESASRKLVYAAAREFQRLGSAVEIFDQKENSLPLFDDEAETSKHAAVQSLFRMVSGADVVILCSPEYHGSMSAALKNALDWLSLNPEDKSCTPKLCGIMGGGGSLGNSGAALQLMMAVRSMHWWLMPDVIVGINEIWEAFDESGELSRPADRERLADFVQKLRIHSGRFRTQ